MDKVQDIQEKNVKDSTIISENLIYGQQRKHFPKRADLQNEIAKNQIL